MKLVAAANSPTEIILHVDSDAVFVRHLTADAITPEPDKVRLYCTPDPAPLATHRLWHQVAHRLLGLSQLADHRDYIGNVIVWRRSVVRRLLQRIEDIGRRDWKITLARTPHFSEYILYGTFAMHEGSESTGHVATAKSLTLDRWAGAFEGHQDKTSFADSIKSHEIACCLQSTIPMTLDDRRRIISLVEAAAARESE